MGLLSLPLTHSVNNKTMHNFMITIAFMYLAIIHWNSCQVYGQNLAKMQQEIEKQRETVRIKNKILEELENVGAKVNKQDFQGAWDHKSNGLLSGSVHKKMSKSDNLLDTTAVDIVPTGQPEPEPILILGEQASAKKDSCLIFKVGKKIKDKQVILPFRMNLYLHVRMIRSKSKGRKNAQETRQSTQGSSRRHKRSSDSKERRRNRKRKNDKRRSDKNKKRKRGRRIKLIVSNGTKTLAQMRKRVSKPMWINIDLPISQFPEVISANDSFKLCVKCKRCNKKIKLDLNHARTKKNGRTDPNRPNPDKQQAIPFIHFENRSQLPHPINRNKRSIDVISGSHGRYQHSDTIMTSQRRHLSRACCHKEVFSENITNLSPSILYPESINITFCGSSVLESNPVSENSKSHHMSEALSKTRNVLQCEPRSYDDFNYVFLDGHYNVRRAVIQNLIPNSCKCRYIL